MRDGKHEDIIYLVIALLAVLLNIAEVGFILHMQEKRIFDRLLLSLALSDVLVGVTVSALKATKLHFDGYFAWLKREDFANIFLLSMAFSYTNILAIAIDRFLAVQYPIKHRMLSTAKRANIVIVLLWLSCIIAVAVDCLITYKWRGHVNYTLYSVSISALLFGAAIVVLYCTIFHLICRRKVQTTRSVRVEGTVSRGGFALFLKGPYKAERSVFFTGCIVAISFVICTYPFIFDFLITKSLARVSYTSKALILINSVLNPFIYFFRNYHR